MSSLEAINGFKIEINIVQNIIKDYSHLDNSGKTIILCWTPNRVSIRGNERADTAAKSALSLPITKMKIPARELVPCADVNDDACMPCRDGERFTNSHLSDPPFHSLHMVGAIIGPPASHINAINTAGDRLFCQNGL